jgi:Ni/Fe-hydrogenase subunit HybB-like protein
MAKSKIHPLWYSEFIPILFFVSSIFAGLSLVILEGSISHKVFRSRMSSTIKSSHNDIALGLAKICAGAMFVYFFLKIIIFIHENNWMHLNTTWGYWFLVELIAFVLIPLRLYSHGVKNKNISAVKVASILTLVGILLNRLNTSVIAFNWQVAERYIPTWMEIEVTLTVIIVEILVLRWVVYRLPILSDPPLWAQKGIKPSIKEIFLVKESENKTENTKETEEWKVSPM